jgi:hypothetical protein
MDGLFSHAPEPAAHPGAHPAPPETWCIVVPTGMVEAAEGFLDYLHLWWPTSLYSMAGAGGQLWWDQTRLVEESEDGQEFVWGDTEVWDPPLTVSAEIGLPGAEGDRWVLTMEPDATSCHVHFRAPRPRRRPGQEGSEPVQDDFWGSVLSFYARFMGAGERPVRS